MGLGCGELSYPLSFLSLPLLSLSSLASHACGCGEPILAARAHSGGQER